METIGLAAQELQSRPQITTVQKMSEMQLHFGSSRPKKSRDADLALAERQPRYRFCKG